MIFLQGRIYYKSMVQFDFDKVIAFLSQHGIELFAPNSAYAFPRKDRDREIFAYDNDGNYYPIVSLKALEEKLKSKDFLSFYIWLDDDRINWMFYHDRLFSFVFYFDLVDREKFNVIVKIIFELFLSEISKKSLLGMYIDKLDRTEEFDWENFFSDERARLDILPDTVCVRKEKLDYVKVADGYIVPGQTHLNLYPT